MPSVDTVIKNHLDAFDKIAFKAKPGEPGSRFMSWEYCHNAFVAKKNRSLTSGDVDELALNLAFYLASWGMYRGSSFLLDRDYKAHCGVVKICMEPKYEPLWDFNPNFTPQSTAEAVNLLFDNDGQPGLVRRIKSAYGQSVLPTDTLVTKILLGVFGCIPALDQYFNNAQKALQKNTPSNSWTLTPTGFTTMCNFAIGHAKILKSIRNYPIMKCLDIALWRVGRCMTFSKNSNQVQWNQLDNLGCCTTPQHNLAQIKSDWLF